MFNLRSQSINQLARDLSMHSPLAKLARIERLPSNAFLRHPGLHTLPEHFLWEVWRQATNDGLEPIEFLFFGCVTRSILVFFLVAVF